MILKNCRTRSEHTSLTQRLWPLPTMAALLAGVSGSITSCSGKTSRLLWTTGLGKTLFLTTASITAAQLVQPVLAGPLACGTRIGSRM
jgi:hypothetical protein